MPTIRIEYEVPEDDCVSCGKSFWNATHRSLYCKEFKSVYLKRAINGKFNRCQACIDAEIIGGIVKFEITRTSSYFSKGQPCGGSFKEGDLWFIEVQTIDDLMELVKAQDEIIVSLRNGIPELEIYDDYRE